MHFRILIVFAANLGQAFLSRVPHLIANFLITFAILKKLLANLLRNIAISHSRLKGPHFLLEVPHFLLEVPRVLTSCVKVLTYIDLTNSYFFYYNSQRQMNEFCFSGWILLLIYKEYLSPHFVAKFICLADRDALVDGQSNRFILKM